MPDSRKPDRGETEVSKKAPQSATPERHQRELAQEAERKAAQAQRENVAGEVPSAERVW